MHVAIATPYVFMVSPQLRHALRSYLLHAYVINPTQISLLLLIKVDYQYKLANNSSN